MDVFTPEKRSQIMRRVRSGGSRAELAVRKKLHAMGRRFRLHRRDLPGCPDIVMPGMRRIVFVHGCFWHRHDCPAGRKVPASNRDYWFRKLERNRLRDRENKAKLEAMGWRVLVIWECEALDEDRLNSILEGFLS